LKTITRILGAFTLLALLAMPGARLHAQASDSPKPAAAAGAEHMDEPESNSETEQYRHSSVVKAIARFTHLSTEATAQIIEDLNSGVLLAAIAFFLWKMLPTMFRSRTETLQKDLVAARLATEDANRRLAEVEARLLRLDSEIGSIRQQVEQESIEDEKRIHAALEAERERVIASAEQPSTTPCAGFSFPTTPTAPWFGNLANPSRIPEGRRKWRFSHPATRVPSPT